MMLPTLARRAGVPGRLSYVVSRVETGRLTALGRCSSVDNSNLPPRMSVPAPAPTPEYDNQRSLSYKGASSSCTCHGLLRASLPLLCLLDSVCRCP
jgi:hypothetical protein